MSTTDQGTSTWGSSSVPVFARPFIFYAVRACLYLALAAGLDITVQAQILVLPIPGSGRVSYSGGRQVLIPQFDPSLGTLTSVTVAYTVQYSGTIGGYGTGGANNANGWATEFSGTIRLSAISMGNVDFGVYNSRSGLVYQTGSPVFQAFGPSDLANATTFSSGLDPYLGIGNISATLSWPTFTADLFFSRGGVKTTTTRDLGAIGGQVTYFYTPAVPEPSIWVAWTSLALVVWACLRRGLRV